MRPGGPLSYGGPTTAPTRAATVDEVIVDTTRGDVMGTVSYRDITGNAAENYQRFFVPAIGRPVATPLLRAADIRTGERVLDVACGTGVLTRLAAELVGPDGAVAGLDAAPDMIAVARATAAPGAPEIEWHVGDATSLPFPDASFDLVTCQMGLMFMDRSTAAAEMHRVLTPGGRVAVSTPGRMQPSFEVLERAIVEHLGAELGNFVRAVFSMHEPDEVAGLLRTAGFADVATSEATVRLELPEPAEFLWEYINLTPMAPIVAQAPEASKAAMERQVAEQAARFVVDGGIPVDQPMVIATGRG
jgi:ubiquinone/menaquinone biosynthesis C-methylase UbiE